MYLSPASVKQCKVGLIFSNVSHSIGFSHIDIPRLIGPLLRQKTKMSEINNPFSSGGTFFLTLSAGKLWLVVTKVQWDISNPQACTEFFVACITWGAGTTKKITWNFCTLSVRIRQFTTCPSSRRQDTFLGSMWGAVWKSTISALQLCTLLLHITSCTSSNYGFPDLPPSSIIQWEPANANKCKIIQRIKTMVFSALYIFWTHKSMLN